MSQTLLLSTRFTTDSNAMWRAAVDAGWDTARLSLNEAARYPVHMPLDAVYGEFLFAEALAQARPDLRLLGPPLDWLAHLPQRFLGRVVGCEPLSVARRRTERTFIKPTISKQFVARIYQPWAELVAHEIDDDPLVLVSTPVHFRCEARTFVDPAVGVLASSLYERDGQLKSEPLGEFEEAVHNLVAELCREGLVPVPMVVDVGLVRPNKDEEWVVIEANEAWGAGLYACNPDAAFRVVSRSCARRPGPASEPVG